MYKVNADGAVFLYLKAVGIGAIIRYVKSRVMVALSKKIHAPLGAIEAKEKAFEMGLQFAKDVDICDLTLEGDSLIVCRALLDLNSPPQ